MKFKKLSEKWTTYLLNKPESGMGYQIVTVTLTDGRKFDNVVIIQSALITEIKGYNDIPFDPSDIASIEVTNQTYWSNRE